MQEGPDELPRNVLEPEFEMRVLIDGVVTGVKRQAPDRITLALG